MFLKILQNLQENTCTKSFFNKASGLQIYWKRDSDRGAFQWILQNF